MDAADLKHLSIDRLADSVVAAMQRASEQLKVFREAELKRLGKAFFAPQDVLPTGWQQRALVALLQVGGSGELAAITRRLAEEHGDANKSTVHQALESLDGSFVVRHKRKRSTEYELSGEGRLVAAAVADVERSAKAFSIGAFAGGRRGVERLIIKLNDWNTSLSRFLALADRDKASMARLYDYVIGGSFNFVVDRLTAADIESRMPWAQPAALLNRAFLHEAVSRLSAEGIRQFIDVGAGLPTTLNTHEVAAQFGNNWRVVYVDSDKSVVEIGRSLLDGIEEHAQYVHGSFENLGAMLDDEPFRILDRSQPIALIAVAVLHFVQLDTVVSAALESVTLALPPKSRLVLSHGWRDEKIMSAEDLKISDDIIRTYQERTDKRVRLRSKGEIASLLQEQWTPCTDGELDFIPNVLRRWQATSPFLQRLEKFPSTGKLQLTPESSLILGTVQELRGCAGRNLRT